MLNQHKNQRHIERMSSEFRTQLPGLSHLIVLDLQRKRADNFSSPTKRDSGGLRELSGKVDSIVGEA